VLDTVIDGKSGIYFQEPTVQSIMEVVQQFQYEIDAYIRNCTDQHGIQ